MESNSGYISVGSHCPNCGKPYVYIGDAPVSGWTPGTEPYCICSRKSTIYSTQPVGWQCPLCKTIYAPWVSECYKCSVPNTYSSSSTWSFNADWSFDTDLNSSEGETNET